MNVLWFALPTPTMSKSETADGIGFKPVAGTVSTRSRLLFCMVFQPSVPFSKSPFCSSSPSVAMACAAFCCGLPGLMRSIWMPRRSHHTASLLSP